MIVPAEFWLLTGLVLLGLELAAPGVFMMWIGLAAIGVGLLTLGLAPALSLQVVAFALLAGMAIALGLLLRRRGSGPALNLPTSGLVGRSATALAFRGREGRVRLGDSDWSAQLTDDASAIAPEAVLEVVGVRGTVLLVRPR